ncbi:YggS family pyridoxal phosphate-dependent enzyme [Candidatus Woesearchaeota archaeon]|nr:YggS family pyridoxal phosphate-dependent enzyme [Candidatus Woesearchaeota archaeon]
MNIKDNIKEILEECKGVKVLAAVKGRSPEEINEAIKAGIQVIGENYVQDAEKKIPAIKKVPLHCIGHLQMNKVKKAVKIFDMIQTVDSEKLAAEINKQSKGLGKIIPVLIEVNSAREQNKAGCMPEDVEELAEKISEMKNLELKGLMTMGPEEDVQPYFKLTKQLFDKIKEKYNISILSMGMSDSYGLAIQEGATMVRIGTRLFKAR